MSWWPTEKSGYGICEPNKPFPPMLLLVMVFNHSNKHLIMAKNSALFLSKCLIFSDISNILGSPLQFRRNFAASCTSLPEPWCRESNPDTHCLASVAFLNLSASLWWILHSWSLPNSYLLRQKAFLLFYKVKKDGIPTSFVCTFPSHLQVITS